MSTETASGSQGRAGSTRAVPTRIRRAAGGDELERLRRCARGDPSRVGGRHAMSVRLRAYLALERAMLDLDEASDPLADVIRDRMDDVWYALSEEDRSRLDRRTGSPDQFGGRVALIIE